MVGGGVSAALQYFTVTPLSPDSGNCSLLSHPTWGCMRSSLVPRASSLTVILILSLRGLSAPAHLCRLVLTALEGRVDGTLPEWLAQLQAGGGATDTFPGPGKSTRLHL